MGASEKTSMLASLKMIIVTTCLLDVCLLFVCMCLCVSVCTKIKLISAELPGTVSQTSRVFQEGI